MYLINDTTGHFIVVPPTGIPEQRGVSEKAQSLSPINLALDSFQESLVMPTVTKKRLTANSSSVLSENNGSNNEIVYANCRRKRNSAPLPASQSSKVQVIEQVELDLEVNTQVDLPQTGHFGEHFALQVDHEYNADLDSSETDMEGNSLNLLAKYS